MNLFDLSTSDLLIWGIVLHLIADWPLQNDYLANNKMKRRTRNLRHGDGMMTPPRMYQPSERWWDRHPAAYIHAGIHGILLALIFGWVAALLALAHLLIDIRVPVVWWSKLVKQTQPQNHKTIVFPSSIRATDQIGFRKIVLLYDVGTEVRFWTDQVFHIVCIAVAALLISI
jgi:hypothetical protein